MYLPSSIKLQADPVQLEQLDLNSSVVDNKKHYLSRLNKLQKQLLNIQQAFYHQDERAIIVLEGQDASGKGGLIRRLTEKLDPRGYRVYPISAPNKEEQSRHYLYRFQKHLPPAGKMAIFDRSYYGRVLVERVEGFANTTEWQRAYQEINEFERMLVDDRVKIIKLYLHTSPEEQLKRFVERLNNPLKRWKLTEEDIRNREKWPFYIEAANEMFKYTSTEAAPWHAIAAEHKWFARLSGLEVIAKGLSNNLDTTPPPIDPAIVKLATDKLRI
ncbi:polyphosphate kinase 2 family protein [Thalassotalea marina]|uniref:Polyphosphate kinase-2-related domain-containing protein n=1 Tax=Thalassotalea marina TaxID=1673741 RepID=A0A919EM52_9GAMM|nr:polyphosphate kinase [Thalassotalea marina]GHF97894.1 hypothetical protein GCM10017161_27760 [Thalassotalea marina]